METSIANTSLELLQSDSDLRVNYIDKQIAELLERKQKLNDHKYRLREFQNQFEYALPEIEAKLAKLGLKFSKLNLVSTGGMMTDGIPTGCKIEANAVSTGKFKFYTHRGYDRNGRTKNNKKMEEKASKLREALTTHIFSVNINEFSLEDSDRVMITFYTK